MASSARWGAPLLPELADDAEFHASWLALTLTAHLDAAAAAAEPTTLRITFDGEPLEVAVDAAGLRRLRRLFPIRDTP